jgi:hypothetical protein
MRRLCLRQLLLPHASLPAWLSALLQHPRPPVPRCHHSWLLAHDMDQKVGAARQPAWHALPCPVCRLSLTGSLPALEAGLVQY